MHDISITLNLQDRTSTLYLLWMSGDGAHQKCSDNPCGCQGGVRLPEERFGCHVLSIMFGESVEGRESNIYSYCHIV
jgi:hypothetical protein